MSDQEAIKKPLRNEVESNGINEIIERQKELRIELIAEQSPGEAAN